MPPGRAKIPPPQKYLKTTVAQRDVLNLHTTSHIMLVITSNFSAKKNTEVEILVPSPICPYLPYSNFTFCNPYSLLTLKDTDPGADRSPPTAFRGNDPSLWDPFFPQFQQHGF